MQKRLGLLFLGFLLSFQSFAQTWTRMQSWGLDLEAITWINENLGFAVGENLIIRTQDGGTTWEEMQVSYEGKLLDLTFITENQLIAVGENGLILRSGDGGKIWSTINSGTALDLKSISGISSNKLLAIGAQGIILRSEDAGQSWQKLNSGSTQSLNDIHFASADTAFIAANAGEVLRSVDQGNTWTPLSSGQSTNLNAIRFSSSLIGYAAGNAGLILKTLDAGESWSPLISPVSTDLHKIEISPLDSRIITIVGTEATALRSTNSGASFGKANLGATNTRYLKGLAFKPGSNAVFAVGQEGYLISSTNAGSSYSQRLAGIRNNFHYTDFKTDRLGYFAGQNGAVYVTSNAGTSVVPRPIPEPVDIQGMDFWNNSFGYIGLENGKIYRTGNSGASWVAVPAQTTATITGFYLFATSVIYASGTHGYITRSFDSGATWDNSIISNTEEDLRDLMFFDFQYGFAIGKNGHISWSNGGNEWETLPKITNENLTALAKLDTTQAVVVGENGVILRTEDKGRTWEQIQTAVTSDFSSVDFWDTAIGFISGENGVTLQTNDGGKTWRQLPSGTSRNLHAISTGNPNSAFAVGDDGTLLQYICSTPGALGEISGPPETCLSTSTYEIPDGEVLGSELVWRVDGGEIISGQGTSQIEVHWQRPGRNGVFVSRQSFCGNGKTSAMEVLTGEIPDGEIPILGNGAVCAGETNTYTVTELPGVSYTWKVSGGEIITGQGSAEVGILWNQTGEQNLEVQLENSCGKAAPLLLPISVNKAPDQPGAIVGEDLVGLWESTYTVPAVEGVNYKWEISGSSASILEGQGTNSVKVLWQVEGEYTLTVAAQNECDLGESQQLNVKVSVITSVPEKADVNITIYPNPSSGKVKIQLGEGNWNSLKVVHAIGYEIVDQSIAAGTEEITLSDLPKGILLIYLESRTEVVVRKVLVE
ncbi:YCF48-related protein [Algoriphagus halophytocola]|uniref:YCF48-related protein n=1 Tax=Algoriphagus halophytocola TaxID=2991499 RepID=UPI0022DDDBB2|nr:YCF48-related protein [Algoriphagus sp. TR-M9]WBL42531.1 YCF48-related protein [Algoriphagus sp. TR-M9]